MVTRSRFSVDSDYCANALGFALGHYLLSRHGWPVPVASSRHTPTISFFRIGYLRRSPFSMSLPMFQPLSSPSQLYFHPSFLRCRWWLPYMNARRSFKMPRRNERSAEYRVFRFLCACYLSHLRSSRAVIFRTKVLPDVVKM